MKLFIVLAALVALPLVGCSSYNSKKTVAAAPTDTWAERKDNFIAGSQAKLDSLYKKVEGYEKSGKLVKASDARKAKNEAEDLREDITDLKKELNEEAKDISADEWEKEHLDLQSEVNELEQKVSEFTSRYRR